MALKGDRIAAITQPGAIERAQAAEVVDATRMSAVGADELVSRWVDRFLLRRQQRRTHVDNVRLESEKGVDTDDDAPEDGGAATTEQEGRDG